MKVAALLCKVPSQRNTFKRWKMLDSRYNVIKKIFKDKIKGLNSITLTIDIWTDTMQTRSFLGYYYSFLWRRNGICYIRSIWTCEERLIDTSKVLTVVTEVGAKVVKAIDIAFGKKVHVVCFAHLLNLVAQIYWKN